MGHGLPYSRSRIDLSNAVGQNTPVVEHYKFSGLSVVVDENSGGVGFGTAKISDFPQGMLLISGVAAWISAAAQDTNVSDDWEGDIALGSSPAASATLAATDVNILAASAVTADSGAKDLARANYPSAVAGVVLDNTAGDLELNFNILIDAADISADATFLVAGDIHICIAVLGDD